MQISHHYRDISGRHCHLNAITIGVLSPKVILLKNVLNQMIGEDPEAVGFCCMVVKLQRALVLDRTSRRRQRVWRSLQIIEILSISSKAFRNGWT